MSIETKPGCYVRCDNCGELHGPDWENINARRNAEEDGWEFTDQANDYCPDCSRKIKKATTLAEGMTTEYQQALADADHDARHEADARQRFDKAAAELARMTKCIEPSESMVVNNNPDPGCECPACVLMIAAVFACAAQLVGRM